MQLSLLTDVFRIIQTSMTIISWSRSCSPGACEGNTGNQASCVGVRGFKRKGQTSAIQTPRSILGRTSLAPAVKLKQQRERSGNYTRRVKHTGNMLTGRWVQRGPAGCEASSRWSCWRRPEWRWHGEHRPPALV